ncbi:unnamed protein product [Rotaria socialis]|uniref:G domain-containing protein n=1 Tax=Rotaria socialis TaxID=392032 RepID=A0A821GSA6_9BILA|nr:unnamed protein product [Rotaria socialis]
MAKNALVKLANETKTDRLDGTSVGLFGLTLTGKSTMLNARLGQSVSTGVGETTTEIKAYKGTNKLKFICPMSLRHYSNHS